jgi:pimeloyl-ACP methyl ester carboxylesterase
MGSTGCSPRGLGLKRVRLVIGNSMGGMHTFLWGGKHPDFMDASSRWPRNRPRWPPATG